ncbi:MAG: hypothetical protein WCL08_02300 [Verrucomicrobiota bacterium]
MSAEPFQSLPPPQKETPPQGASQPRRVVLGGGAPEANRNLLIGVALVLLTVPLGGAAFCWAPRETFVAVTTAVLVGLLLFLAMQFRVLLQRNGTFLILALAFAMTLLVPLLARLAAAGSDWMQMLAEMPKLRAQLASMASLPPQTPPAPLAAEDKKAELPASGVAIASQSQATPKALANTTSAVKMTEPESPKPAAPAPEAEPEPLRPGEDPVQRTTRLSKEEAVRRFPALQTPGTQEHTKYIEAYNELARLRKFDFFTDPRWPLTLAETVAAREGWVRASGTGNSSAPVPATKGEKLALLPGSEIALDSPQSPIPEDTNTQAINRAMIEARRRYPEIGIPGSPENQAYLDYYKDIERARPEFFEKTDWPIRLADAVARREGWKRADGANSSTRNVADTQEPSLPR